MVICQALLYLQVKVIEKRLKYNFIPALHNCHGIQHMHNVLYLHAPSFVFQILFDHRLQLLPERDVVPVISETDGCKVNVNCGQTREI